MGELNNPDRLEEPVQPVEKEPSAADEQSPVEQADRGGQDTAPCDGPASMEECRDPGEKPAAESREHPENDRTLEQVLEATLRISEQVGGLADIFHAKLMHSAHEEKIVDQMHKELQAYKGDLYAQLLRPILLDIIEVRDSIMRIGAVYRAKPEGERDIPNKTFSDYTYDLQDILEKNNVEIYQSQPGDAFTAVRQRAIKKIATDRRELHGTIAESLSCGYHYNGRTLSAEKVVVYVYEEPSNDTGAEEVTANG